MVFRFIFPVEFEGHRLTAHDKQILAVMALWGRELRPFLMAAADTFEKFGRELGPTGPVQELAERVERARQAAGLMNDAMDALVPDWYEEGKAAKKKGGS